MRFPISGAGSLFEQLANWVTDFLSSTDVLPGIEFATFSGKESDVISKEGAIYLRLQWQRASALDDQPAEISARLVGPSGLWHIPTEETQMIVFFPPNTFGGAGNAWCMWGAMAPPAKVALNKAAMSFADTVAFVSKAKTHAFKSVDDFVFGTFTGPTDDEKGFSAGWKNGTRIAITRTAIELQITDDSSTPQVMSRLRLDRTGIKMISGGVTVALDRSSGQFTTKGNGFYAAHSGGVLGISGTLPIGNPVAASASWVVTP